MGHEQRAYAKIMGPGWAYYMTKPKIVLGRGGENVNCDVVISTESAVSRQHFTIRFTPELQAFEVENLSKNGILVNGEFVRRVSPPVLLRARADIMYGRFDPMRLTFILPEGRSKVATKQTERYTDKGVPLWKWVGEVLVAHNGLPASRVCEEVEREHPNQLKKIGNEQMIENSIRHFLTQNDHIFTVAPSTSVETVPQSSQNSATEAALITVRAEHKSRYFGRLTEKEANNHKRGVCRDEVCITARHAVMPSDIRP